MKFLKIDRERILEQKTVWIFRLRLGGAVFLFLLFFPYAVTALLFGQSAAYGREAAEKSRILVCAESGADGNVCIRMDMEEYLVGCLAGAIPAAYEPAALQAQAVLLRTLLIRAYRESMESVDSMEQGKGQAGILVTDTHGYVDRARMKQMWGMDFAANYEKIRRAVAETRGIYLTYRGEPILASYFRVSGGKTRDGEILAGNGDAYPYLQSVRCPKDYLSEDYLQDGRAAGLGHGLGMSQFAANEMAKSGAACDEILHYFFTDITIDKFE